MELTSNSTKPITPEESNSVAPNLINSPVTPNATLFGSNQNTNIETLSPCNCYSAPLNINSSKNILKFSVIGMRKLRKLRTLFFLQNEVTEKNKIIKFPSGNPNSRARCKTDLTIEYSRTERNGTSTTR